jgi:hypothetical protein
MEIIYVLIIVMLAGHGQTVVNTAINVKVSSGETNCR